MHKVEMTAFNDKGEVIAFMELKGDWFDLDVQIKTFKLNIRSANAVRMTVDIAFPIEEQIADAVHKYLSPRQREHAMPGSPTQPNGK